MKKYVLGLLIGAGLCAMTACGGDDDEAITVSPNSVSMHYDETQQLTASGATRWMSENDYVATVDQRGLVKGNHVGTTRIGASNGDRMGRCTVTITPKYELYDTPILKWGASLNSIKKEDKHALKTEDSDVLGYVYENGSLSTTVLYGFENNKLTNVMALVSNTYFDRHGLYLLERYQPVGYDDNFYVFMDALNKDLAKTIIMLSTENLSGTKVALAIYTSSDILTRGGVPEVDAKLLKKCNDIMKYMK